MHFTKRKALAFFSGVVIVGSAVATLIIVCPKLRNELERQSSQLLASSRDVITKSQMLAQKIQNVSGVIGSLKSEIITDAPQLPSPQRRAYEAQWSKKHG